jgi:hypothetical protein
MFGPSACFNEAAIPPSASLRSRVLGWSGCLLEKARRRLVSCFAFSAALLKPSNTAVLRASVSRGFWSICALPETICSRLLKSCAMPPVSCPIACSFSPCRRASSAFRRSSLASNHLCGCHLENIGSGALGETAVFANTALLIALVAAPPAPSASGLPDSDIVALKTDSAVAYGDDGKPLFRAPRDYLLRVAGNPDGHVTQYDAENRMVRISPAQAPGVWLSCAEVAPMKNACAAGTPSRGPTRRPSRGTTAKPTPLGAIPACPGDPRCPRL